MRAHPEWGCRNSFACAACEQEVTTFGGIVPPAGLAGLMGMALCKPCASRMARDNQFGGTVTAKAAGIAARALVQRIADALCLHAPVVQAALVSAKAQGRMGGIQIDEALGLRPGQFDAALVFALGALPHD